jgi:methyl-accepting chemotaxis protein
MRARLLLQILPGVALAVIALTVVAVTTVANAQRDAVYGQMSQMIAKEAARFDGDARRGVQMARRLAGV